MILMYLSLGALIEVEAGGHPTLVGRGVEFLPEWLRGGLRDALLPSVLLALPLLGLLMVSRVPYAHAASALFQRRAGFNLLVQASFIAGGLYLAPVPVLFFSGLAYVLHGVVRHGVRGQGSATASTLEDREAA